MSKFSKIAFLFPGQGAQYPGMGVDLYQAYPQVRETFEEGNDLLKRNLSKIILNGPEEELTLTYNSQPAIYLLSLAYLKVLKSLFPDLKPQFAAGLSLGEYTALTAAGILDEAKGMVLVEKRGRLMGEACQKHPGTMAAILGLSQNEVETLVNQAQLPCDLWAANFNAPGQTVLSGTLKGVERGCELARKMGAKKVIPLTVQGAFHSGLMKGIEDPFAEKVGEVPLNKSSIKVPMNASGGYFSNLDEVKELLVKQISHPVRWQENIETLEKDGVDLYLEIGCGRTLSSLNKRIGVKAPTLNFEKMEDLELIAKEWR